MDEIEHNRMAREFAGIEQNWHKWSTTANSPQGDSHMCNCIGCCRKCGMCSTHPRHTPTVCKNLVQHDAYRQHVIYDD